MKEPFSPSTVGNRLNTHIFLSVGGIGLFVLLVVALHFLQAQANPLFVPLSDYVLGAWGWLMTIAFFSLSFGSWQLYQEVRRTRAWASWRVGQIGLGLWIGGVILAGIFPTDAENAPFTWHGIIHGIAATVAIGSLVVVEIGMVRRPVGQPLRWLSPLLGGLALAALIPNFITGYFGLFERVIISIHIVWLFLVNVCAIAARAD